MRIEKMRLACKCGHVFDADTVVEAPIAVVTAVWGAIRCEKCGSDKLGLGGELGGKPPVSERLEVRANWWRQNGDTGASSLTIWRAFTGGVHPYGRDCYPRDPDDFRRCKLLLDLIPEWRQSFSTVSERFPWFQPFVDAWPDFERLWAEESPKGRCLKLYEAMLAARAKADALRGKAA